MKSAPVSSIVKEAAVVIAAVLMSVAQFACKSGKPFAKAEDEVKFDLPFSADRYQSDAKFIRSVFSHKSEDISQAKVRATMKAQMAIAQAAGSLTNGLLKEYVDERKITDTELNGRYQSMGEIWIHERLTNCNIIGEELYKNKNTGLYTYWIAMELDRDELYKETVKRIKSDDRLRQDFDEQNFRKIYEEGIKKLEKEQVQ